MMLLTMLTMWTDASDGIGLATAELMVELALELGENHPDRLVALSRGPWGDIVFGD